ncbi:hypothetical protein CDD83_2758 [Cordyceps sp. RAO-2017]|nr:hypothetical protein CDD83_2758 [Cordyceps sp. RAO-2017]
MRLDILFSSLALLLTLIQALPPPATASPDDAADQESEWVEVSSDSQDRAQTSCFYSCVGHPFPICRCEFNHLTQKCTRQGCQRK